MFDCCSVRFCSIVFNSVRFPNVAWWCWEKFGVSSIKFDYRTQSKSIERLEFDWIRLPKVRLTTPDINNHSPTQTVWDFFSYCASFHLTQLLPSYKETGIYLPIYLSKRKLAMLTYVSYRFRAPGNSLVWPKR